MEMEKSDLKKLSVSLGSFSCQIEGFDDPMSVLQEVTAHMRELSNSEAAFLSHPERRNLARPGQTIQVQPHSQSAISAARVAYAADAGDSPTRSHNSTAQALRNFAAMGTEASSPQSPRASARSRTDPRVDFVDAPDAEAVELNNDDRIDECALAKRIEELLDTKAMPDAKDFVERMKAEKPGEKFEAGAAFLIHFLGYRHVTPKQVDRVLRRAEVVDEPGLANLDELVAGLMKSGRIGGNMQEGLCLGSQSPYAKNQIMQ